MQTINNPIISVTDVATDSITIHVDNFGQTQNEQARDLTLYINNNLDVAAAPVAVKKFIKGQSVHVLKSLFVDTEYYIFVKNNLDQISNTVSATTTQPVTPTPTPSGTSGPTPTPTPTPTPDNIAPPSLDSWFTSLSTFNLFDGTYFSIGYLNEDTNVTVCRYNNSNVSLSSVNLATTLISVTSGIEVKTNYPIDRTLFWIGGFSDIVTDNNPEDSIIVELPINGYTSSVASLNNGFAASGIVLSEY
jgi:hypothetical protein